jgi:hypothetical protein
MKIEHREWTIDSQPKKENFHWHAWVEVERKPRYDEDDGQIFHFFDIGCGARARDRLGKSVAGQQLLALAHTALPPAERSSIRGATNAS